MRKISDINDLMQKTVVVERRINDFSNMDLSHLDLSKFVPEFWEDAIFYNTNFSNTGIRFKPEKLQNRSIEKCNFENVNLSHIAERDWAGVNIIDANLRNTGATIDIPHLQCFDKTIGEVLLDERYSEKTAEYWDKCKIDLKTLEANRFIRISPHKLFELIQDFIKGRSTFLTQNQIIRLVEQCEEILKEFDDGELTRLYELVCNNFDFLDKLKFFQGSVKGKFYQDFILDGFSTKLLEMIKFSKCSFEEIEINNGLENLLCSNISFLDEVHENSFQTIKLTDLNLDSWKKLKTRNRKLGPITFKSLMYLEIGMNCNCNCKICRNKSFDCECEERDLNKILANLSFMQQYVDTLFIGGGEPALYIEDIIKIRERFRKLDLIIVTNGSIKKETLDIIRENRIDIYISRHAISEEENCNILNPVNSINILSMKDIEEFAKKNKVVLTPVCVKGGLDSSKKIVEYIAMSFEYGVREILISSLHRDASMGRKGIDYENLYVDQNIFNDVFTILTAQGFKRKKTICSTGGYILIRFVKNYYYIVSFKIYISKKDFPEYWKNCIKRTFDFTMRSNGDVYQDWCRNSLVNLEELKVLTEV